jgi:hypothetical protein
VSLDDLRLAAIAETDQYLAMLDQITASFCAATLRGQVTQEMVIARSRLLAAMIRANVDQIGRLQEQNVGLLADLERATAENEALRRRPGEI